MRKRTEPQPAAPSTRIVPQPTPHRPVVSVALVIFVPALWLVLHGNLSVQNALIRFIGALMVGWAVARLVFATVSSYSRSARLAVATRVADSSGLSSTADVAGAGDFSGAAASGSFDIVGTTGLDRSEVVGRPSDGG